MALGEVGGPIRDDKGHCHGDEDPTDPLAETTYTLTHSGRFETVPATIIKGTGRQGTGWTFGFLDSESTEIDQPILFSLAFLAQLEDKYKDSQTCFPSGKPIFVSGGLGPDMGEEVRGSYWFDAFGRDEDPRPVEHAVDDTDVEMEVRVQR